MDDFPLRVKRYHVRRSVPIRKCWAVLVHFDDMAEEQIKRHAETRCVGASALIEKWTVEKLRELKHARSR